MLKSGLDFLAKVWY